MFYISCSFALVVCGGKKYFPNSASFWPLGAKAARKKIPGAGAAWEKIQEPKPEPLKNYPALQPCIAISISTPPPHTHTHTPPPQPRTCSNMLILFRLIGCMDLKDVVLDTITNNGNEIQEHKEKDGVYSIKLKVIMSRSIAYKTKSLVYSYVL